MKLLNCLGWYDEASSGHTYFDLVSYRRCQTFIHCYELDVSFTGKQFADLCIASGIAELNLNHKHVLAAERLQRDPLAKPHKDPFDRILLAQAKVEDMRFVSHDAMLPGYNEPCLLGV